MELEIDKKILVIDDDDLVRKSVQNILVRAGYSVACAADADKALAAIKQQEFDLIVSDIRMPGKNGVETVREIRSIVSEHSPRDIPIIFITGYAESSEELKAEILGEIILKPFDLDHLLITVREYL
ncbi:MAG: response regulator [Chlamydiota bacterium]|nr:response regulator [Chlamydiota bacterium]